MHGNARVVRGLVVLGLGGSTARHSSNIAQIVCKTTRVCVLCCRANVSPLPLRLVCVHNKTHSRKRQTQK